jgi:hypothetical protein
MSLPITPNVIYDEIKSAREILQRWEERFAQPIPSIDSPGSEEQLVQMLRELTGELLVVANKTNGLSVILTERLIK